MFSCTVGRSNSVNEVYTTFWTTSIRFREGLLIIVFATMSALDLGHNSASYAVGALGSSSAGQMDGT